MCNKVVEQLQTALAHAQGALEAEGQMDWTGASCFYFQARTILSCLADNLAIGQMQVTEGAEELAQLVVQVASGLLETYDMRLQDLQRMCDSELGADAQLEMPAVSNLSHQLQVTPSIADMSYQEGLRLQLACNTSGDAEKAWKRQRTSFGGEASTGGGEDISNRPSSIRSSTLPGSSDFIGAPSSAASEQILAASKLPGMVSGPPAQQACIGTLGNGGSAGLDTRDNPMMEDVVQLCIKDVHGSLDDLSGLDQVKKELRSALFLPLKCPHLFRGYRAPPRNFLFYGPPGTGKTCLVHKAAAEAGLRLLCITPSALLSKWSGESEKMLSAVFAAARAMQPCIVFMDEVDSLARSRGAGGGGDDALSRRLLTELLVLMNDGGSSSGAQASSGVYVFAATNRLQDCDAALLRRFDRRIHVPLPDAPARAAFFKLALTLPEMAHSLDLAVDMVKLVDISDGLSCAEMAAVCREACMQPVDELQASLLQGDVVMEGDAVQLRKLLWQDFEVAFARCQSVKAQQLEQSSQVA